MMNVSTIEPANTRSNNYKVLVLDITRNIREDKNLKNKHTNELLPFIVLIISILKLISLRFPEKLDERCNSHCNIPAIDFTNPFRFNSASGIMKRLVSISQGLDKKKKCLI